ncbi:MAG: hypothetical protein GXP62_20550 [Oligoflexia bacterium]|nr:hypothetical protein [Oligoflexia bacterium]
MVPSILITLVVMVGCKKSTPTTDSGGADTAATADSGAGTGPITVADDRPILLYTDGAPVDADMGQLPKGFTVPDETVCAADPTRQYIAEIVTNGIGDIEVKYHWAPVIPGPDADHPTIDQPEWWYAGSFNDGNDSSDDVLADHPFGLDYSFDSTPDNPYSFMSFQSDTADTLHIEIEQRIFPRATFGFEPQPGGRTLLRGVWVLDCGHPPYGAEMHPPTFLSFANQDDAATTHSFAVVAPYRSSLLFNPDLSLANDFSNQARVSDADTLPFPNAFIAAVLDAVTSGAANVQSPALMVANHFDPIDYLVCAPLPRPDGAVLLASWHFVARSGVTVHITPYDDAGCVRVHATMDDNYAPMALPYADTPWSWKELSASAGGQLGKSIDVRQEIIDALESAGIDAAKAPALQEDAPPIVDAYATLDPGAGADQETGNDVVTDDDQAYPFFGHVTASWSTP